MEYQSKFTGAEVDSLLEKVQKGGSGGSVIVDSSLSTTSENPVMNKAITSELNKKATKEELTELSAEVGKKADKTYVDNAIAEAIGNAINGEY